MKNEDLFRIFDACKPTVEQVRQYLERISGNAGFKLMFRKNGKEFFTDKAEPHLGELVGVVIEKTLFLAKGLTLKDFSGINKNDRLKLTQKDIFNEGGNYYPKAFPLDENALAILERHAAEYENLTDMLKTFGYCLLPLQEKYLMIDKDSEETCADYRMLDGCFLGNANLGYFLRTEIIPLCAEAPVV